MQQIMVYRGVCRYEDRAWSEHKYRLQHDCMQIRNALVFINQRMHLVHFLILFQICIFILRKNII